MELIDTHCHIDMLHTFPDMEEVVRQAREAGVAHFVMPGVYRDLWPRLFSLGRENSRLHPAPGLHPMYLEHHGDDDLEELSRLASLPETVAIGEIGLDYYDPDSDRAAQIRLFEEQLDIAARYELPVLLHVRKAYDRVLSIIRRKRFSCGGIVHAYGGSLQQAGHYIGLGFKIGVGGTVTYDRARKIRRVAAEIPLESIVLETDSPDIPPSAYHGKRNKPSYLPLVLEALAEIRREPAGEIALQTTATARTLFGIEADVKGV